MGMARPMPKFDRMMDWFLNKVKAKERTNSMTKKQSKSRSKRKVMDMSAQLNLAFTYQGVEFKREIGIVRVDPNDPTERRELNQVFDKTIMKLLTWARLNEAYRASLMKLKDNSDVLKKGGNYDE